MASRVGTAALLEDDSNGTAIVSSSITVQAGDMVVFGSKHETDPGGGTTTTITVTASGGNGTATNGTYKEHTNEGLFTQMAYLLITAGGSITFTQTLTAARRFRRFYIEVFRPGASTTLGFDAENPPAEGTGTTAMSGGTNALTYSATGFAIAFFGEFSGVTYTAGSGWTASGVASALMEYRTTSGSGTLTCNATASSAMDWTAHGMSFKETATGGTTVTGSDTGTLTDRVTGIALDGPKDTGAATERNSIAADLTPPRDTGAMGEGVPGIALALTDTGTLSETSSINTGSTITSSDTGTLADDVSDIQIDDGPEGTLTERVSGIALDGPRDTGTLAEGNAITATLTSTDTATLGESSSITQTGTNPTDSQTISFSESGQVTVTVISADTGTAVDRNAVAAAVSGSDGQSMADAIAALLASLSSADSAQALEAATLTVGGEATGVLTGRVSIAARLTGGVSLLPIVAAIIGGGG